ncbi:uncharacterized protein LOC116297924 [Actinia tenebrosa]|uniref:Uncharacterized protein LOC116297924 n=1 Tax=Actinia tenebrosa TaxID=6105 RepID=A0A6P8I0I3_ACTTE|nr:uncharacterized protein LOC116297924 [Actinia tenebrosa]
MLYSDKERTLAMKRNHECPAITSISLYFLAWLSCKTNTKQRGDNLPCSFIFHTEGRTSWFSSRIVLVFLLLKSSDHVTGKQRSNTQGNNTWFARVTQCAQFERLNPVLRFVAWFKYSALLHSAENGKDAHLQEERTQVHQP